MAIISLRAANDGESVARVDAGGGGPHDPSMEARLRAVEDAVLELRTNVRHMPTAKDLGDLRSSIARLAEAITSKASIVAFETLVGRIDALAAKTPSKTFWIGLIVPATLAIVLAVLFSK